MSVDSFSDDLQLQMSAPPDRISELLHSMQYAYTYIYMYIYI